MDFIHEFKAAIAAAGIEPPTDIIADGTRQRFSSNGKPRDNSGWYILHGDDRPAGSFGCWRSGYSQKWSYSKSKPLTAEEKAAWRKRMETLDAERKQQEVEARAYAAKTAKQMWEAARDDAAHPYLAKKKIPAIGARVLKDMLLIPVKQSATEFVGLQRIWPDGTKRPIKGTPMAGAYAPIGKPERGQKLVICEGWATGVTIHMFTQLPVIVAFTSGNLKPVVEKLQAKLAGFELVIAADDDYQTTKPDGTPWNPGIEAAYATGLPVYIPRWYGDRTGGTDFNDLYIDEGGKAVAECFEMPVPPPIPTKTVDKPVENISEPTPEAEQTKEPESVEAVDNLQEHAEVSMDAPPEWIDEIIDEIQSKPKNLPATADQGEPKSMAQLVAEYGLRTNDKGSPHCNAANCLRVLLLDPQLRKTIWFDEFMDRVMTMWKSDKPREWNEVDDINLQVYLQENYGFTRVGKMTVQDAVLAAAYTDRRNEAKAYIESLQWDGVPRLQAFSREIFGTEDTEYMRMVGQNFWVSMVARVLKPGCKVDTMIVLEGLQGAGKSKALAIIGGQWFTEATQSPTDKDFYLNLAGKMIVEIGEMDAFRKAEVTKVKQVITCQVDRYRAPYERRSADHPRRCVFAGTTNRDDWNKDETGARRFWPVYCRTIDHALLSKNRDQYFAEAAHLVKIGVDWWTMPEEETKKQQEARRDADELEGQIEHFLIGHNEISVYEIMDEMMKLPFDRQDKAMQMRIAKCLRVLGWKRPEVPTWRGGKAIRVWYRVGAPRLFDGEPSQF